MQCGVAHNVIAQIRVKVVAEIKYHSHCLLTTLARCDHQRRLAVDIARVHVDGEFEQQTSHNTVITRSCYMKSRAKISIDDVRIRAFHNAESRKQAESFLTQHSAAVDKSTFGLLRQPRVNRSP
jgi:hypothetical protein